MPITNAVVQAMIQYGFPMTREAYMIVSFPDIDPEDWTAEMMDAIPSIFPHEDDAT
jgi:hypothetical protein